MRQGRLELISLYLLHIIIYSILLYPIVLKNQEEITKSYIFFRQFICHRGPDFPTINFDFQGVGRILFQTSKFPKIKSLFFKDLQTPCSVNLFPNQLIQHLPCLVFISIGDPARTRPPSPNPAHFYFWALVL